MYICVYSSFSFIQATQRIPLLFSSLLFLFFSLMGREDKTWQEWIYHILFEYIFLCQEIRDRMVFNLS